MFTRFAAPRKTVASVMAAFNKTVEELLEVQDIHSAEAKRQSDIIAEAQATKASAEAEAESARNVANKLIDLFSGTLVEELPAADLTSDPLADNAEGK